MVLLTRVSTVMGRSMVKASSHGLMEALLLENFMTITYMEEAFMSGRMEEYSMENGKTTRWRVTVRLLGQTVVATLVSISMT